MIRNKELFTKMIDYNNNNPNENSAHLLKNNERSDEKEISYNNRIGIKDKFTNKRDSARLSKITEKSKEY